MSRQLIVHHLAKVLRFVGNVLQNLPSDFVALAEEIAPVGPRSSAQASALAKHSFS